MPRGQGETPIRGIRVSDELWSDAKRVCADMDSSVNGEIVKFLERLVAAHPLPPDSRR